MEGDLDFAEPLYRQVLALARAIEDRESIAIGLLNLAMVAIGRNEPESARSMLLEAMAIAAETGSKPAGQSALEVAAGLAALRERWTRAARSFGAAEALMAQTGLQRDPADEAFLAPLMKKARVSLGNDAFSEATTSGRGLGFEEATFEVRKWLELWD
jgi:Tetratricopeptide repeat